MSMADWFRENFGAYPTTAIADAGERAWEKLPPAAFGAWRGSIPSRDEFAAWRADPTTRFLMAALSRNADECADQWHQFSWVGGNADQRTLDGLRERADTLRGIAEADYDALCEVLGLEPEKEERAA